MADATEMTCKELVELVTDYLDGAMSSENHARFDEHLAACPFCTIYLEQMRETIRAAGRLSEESISPEAMSELLARFRNWE
jgi:predicted anti-sigma-YlaC factor YlaD